MEKYPIVVNPGMRLFTPFAMLNACHPFHSVPYFLCTRKESHANASIWDGNRFAALHQGRPWIGLPSSVSEKCFRTLKGYFIFSLYGKAYRSSLDRPRDGCVVTVNMDTKASLLIDSASGQDSAGQCMPGHYARGTAFISQQEIFTITLIKWLSFFSPGSMIAVFTSLWRV